ncbi:hypothetical protein TKK_0018839 [Trichogramma kaykai]
MVSDSRYASSHGFHDDDEVIAACLVVFAESRRVQLRERAQEPALYYEEEDEAQPQEADDYASQVAYQPRTRALQPLNRAKDTIAASKPAPVQTIRNYNKVNDDGSFTFGYEAADGSFKEETRGTDCVVRGKYGYVDPDGNKREFTYVSGNPCDPNAPKDEDDDELIKKHEADEPSGPQNYPSVRPVARPSRPNYPTTTQRAPTTIFQSEYQLDDDASQELEEETKPRPASRPHAFRRPTYIQVAAEPSSPVYSNYQSTPAPTTSPTLYRFASTSAASRAPTTPAPVRTTYYQPVETSTRPAVTRTRPQSVAITPRPHIAQVAAQYVSPGPSTERPGVVYAPRTITPVHSSTTATPPSQHLDFAAELERYVNSVGSSTPRPQIVQPKYKPSPSQAPIAQSSSQRPSDAIYQSELVYDPATGQYNTQLYQTLPQTLGEFSLSHKLQPYVAQSQQPLVGLQQSSIYRQAASQPQPAQQIAPQRPKIAQPQEAIYRKQQSQLLQQSQQLYAQQQRRQQQQQPQRIQLIHDPNQREGQNYYYVAAAAQQAPGRSLQQAPLTLGQIDQFLRQGGVNYQ